MPLMTRILSLDSLEEARSLLGATTLPSPGEIPSPEPAAPEPVSPRPPRAPKKRRLAPPEGPVSPITVGEAFDLALAKYQRDGSPTAQPTYRCKCRHLKARFGAHTPLTELTKRRLAAFIDERVQEVSAGTVRGELAVVTAAFKAAWRAGHDVENPVRGLEKPSVAKPRDRVLSPEEEKLLRENMSARDWSVFQFAMLTGMRRLEIFRLRRDDVTFETLEVQGRRVKLGRAHIRESKTGEPRLCPLNPQAVEICEAWIALAENEFIFGRTNADRLQAGINYSVLLARVCKKVGIEDFHFHDLRHCAATNALRNGAKPHEVSKLLGHSSITMTSKYVTLRFEDSLAAAMALSKGAK